MSRASARLAIRHSALGHAVALQMAKFLNADADLGLTFALAALAARRHPKRKERNRINAQKALDAVVKHHGRANLDPDQSAKIEVKIKLLRAALEKLDRKA